MFYTLAMGTVFPNLRLVKGYYVVGDVRYAHWWMEDEDGKIVDPTAAQFAGTQGTYMAVKR